MRHFDLVRTEVAAAAGEVTGELRLASLPTATGPLLAPLIGEFTGHHPRVRVRLLEGFDRDVRAWLERGAVEAGVVTLPAPGLDTVELGSDEMLALLPAAHPLAAAPAVTLAELAREPFILSTGGCRSLIRHATREAGVELDVAFEAGELSAIVGMVDSGLGVSIVPSLGRDTWQGRGRVGRGPAAAPAAAPHAGAGLRAGPGGRRGGGRPVTRGAGVPPPGDALTGDRRYVNAVGRGTSWG
ncbi:LysR family transcriptional regulator substrate-binding protein [Streptomyces litchfieldiae]|uniref:LysR family transcriptional regulator substrate-binding protein n=1 Tax=Streptomyces litchfieldiae TaxID=3075543 RepID=A0ABU2MXB2_9ACTN|nr:LysR family transcriptional regulator substrate-binding protein [Streptomyces sp. DSM 44938]MDT0346296.1 LysR family transcriptional regulator substrate-binding protein [Streptomyces sp. DSM 44938]